MTSTRQSINEDLVVPARLPYMRGIDGLRAVAVMAVLFYHADFGWAKGGFLGVEMFFVISGYLITSLLLVEWLRTGTVGLKEFWIRRARRLLPAVFLLLGVTSVMAMTFYHDTLHRMLGDVAAATGYITNWFLIVKDVSYFETFGRPPLLQHLWSLSVEEQFYVLWPLIFSFGMALFRSPKAEKTIRSFLWFTVTGIVASTALMVMFYTPFEDPSRVYYGTDTRAAGILVGVALALVWIPWKLNPGLNRRAGRSLTILGVAGLAGLVMILSRLDEFSPWLYRGGFLVTSLLTALVIAMTVHPAAFLGGWLENPVMRWIGTRSYGIYLWHWPIFMVTRPGFDVGTGRTVTFIVRTALTFAVAEVSYRFVESPIRHQGFRVWVTGIRRRFGISTVRGGVAAGAVTAAFVTGLLGGLVWSSLNATDPVSVASAPESGVANVEKSNDVETFPSLPDVDGPVVPSGDQPDVIDGSPTEPAGDDFSIGDPTTGDPIELPDRDDAVVTTTIAAAPPSVTLIGDSVLAGASAAVSETLPNELVVDAEVSRQFKHADDVAAELEASGELGAVVVIHLGTNGAFSAATFDEVMESVDDVARVIILTAKVPRNWESRVNDAIAEGSRRWPDVEIVDWHTIAGEHPEWFNDDRVHLNQLGREAYAAMLDRVING